MRMYYSISAIGAIALASTVLLAFPMFARADTCTAEGVLLNDNNETIGTCTPEPAPTSEQYQFQRSGIFGCSQTAAYRMSVGALSAVGGVYVPVNDAAVTLNTGYLVYKECVLDGVSKRIAESASTAHARYGINAFLSGREGGPQYPEDYIADVLARSDQAFLHTFESGALSTLNPALRSDVTRAVARNYYAETRQSNQSLVCPYQGDLSAVLKGNTDDIWGGLLALANPACNPLGAYYLAQEYTGAAIARDREEMLFRLTTGQGVYGVEEYDPATGRYITRTPGSLVAGNIQQLTQSGFRQLENVTEIDQMVGALFSGLSSHIISDNRGLTGLLQPVGGQPSYLDQMTRESAQGLRDAATNAAILILTAARQMESVFLNAMNTIATNLTQTIERLRTAENQCWNLVIENTCATQLASDNTCTSVPLGSCTTNPATGLQTCPSGVRLQIATSTASSQQVIQAQIAPLAEVTIENIETSERAVSLIDNLIAGVTNVTSLDAQRIALQQLDSLVARGAIHNQYDAGQAEQRRDDVAAAMTQLVEDTITAWADSTDPSAGWCNVNNPSVIQLWIERWRN